VKFDTQKVNKAVFGPKVSGYITSVTWYPIATLRTIKQKRYQVTLWVHWGVTWYFSAKNGFVYLLSIELHISCYRFLSQNSARAKKSKTI